MIKDRTRWTNFTIQLHALIEEFDVVDISLLGFPENWLDLLTKYNTTGYVVL